MKDTTKRGMEAVIAKAGKRAPLFKRKLAAKLESASSAKAAPKAEYAEKKADRPMDGKKGAMHEQMHAKLADLESRLTALEAKYGRDDLKEDADEGESEDDMEEDD